ncbi:hypothetical protein EJB05_57436, partial [Eragrostis curvula]
MLRMRSLVIASLAHCKMTYMAPEYIGEGIISIKCHVYAFGATLFDTINSMNRSELPTRRDPDKW